MNHAKNNKTYATFDFDNFNDRGLKTFVVTLKGLGQEVATVTASNRKVKKDGLFTKKALFVFKNSQRVEVVIGDMGDIVLVKINGKNTPFGSPKNEKAFAKNLAKLLERGQDAFDKSLAKQLKKVKVETDVKPAARSIKARIEQGAEALEQAQSNLVIANKRLDDAKSLYAETEQVHANKQSTLDEAKALTVKLRKELSTLEQAQ